MYIQATCQNVIRIRFSSDLACMKYMHVGWMWNRGCIWSLHLNIDIGISLSKDIHILLFQLVPVRQD